MDESQRRELLGRIRSPSGALGEDVPDRIEIQGATLDLKEFVFECKRLEAIPPEERERIEETKRALRRERLERKRRIEDGEITCEEGEELVRSIHGIDRAINALEGLDEPDIGEQLRRKELEDASALLALADRSV
jgi:tRNA pseudouridine-54 N-methylase